MRTRRNGVTLIEICVCSAILLVIFIVLFNGLFTGRRAAEKGLDHLDRLGQVNRLLEHIKRAVRFATSVVPATLPGGGESYTITFMKGVDGSLNPVYATMVVTATPDGDNTKVLVEYAGKKSKYFLKDMSLGLVLQQNLATITLTSATGNRQPIALSLFAPFLPAPIGPTATMVSASLPGMTSGPTGPGVLPGPVTQPSFDPSGMQTAMSGPMMGSQRPATATDPGSIKKVDNPRLGQADEQANDGRLASMQAGAVIPTGAKDRGIAMPQRVSPSSTDGELLGTSSWTGDKTKITEDDAADFEPGESIPDPAKDPEGYADWKQRLADERTKDLDQPDYVARRDKKERPLPTTSFSLPPEVLGEPTEVRKDFGVPPASFDSPFLDDNPQD